MSDDDRTYNGWTNYTTWCVHLWMTSNDEATYKNWRRIARATYRSASSSTNPTRTRRENAAYELAKTLKDEHSENIPDEPSGVYFDLLRSALDDVNWQEIADNFLDAEIEEEEDTDDE